MTAGCRRPASSARVALRPAVLEPEEGFEPSTFRLPVEPHESSRYQPGRFSLLMSAGSSVECAPDLWCYGSGLTHGLGEGRSGVLPHDPRSGVEGTSAAELANGRIQRHARTCRPPAGWPGGHAPAAAPGPQPGPHQVVVAVE